MDRMTFDQPVTVPVEYGGESYELREADGATALAYKNAQTRGAKVADGKITADLTGLAESQYVLVGGCLHKGGKPVGTNAAKAFPNRMVEALYKAAREISGLEDAKTEPELMKAVLDSQKALLDFRRAKAGGGSDDPKAPQPASTDGSA